MRGTLLELQPEVPPDTGALPTVGAPPDIASPPGVQTATAARACAVVALARTLEVLDGRRPRGLLAGDVDETVLTQIGAMLQRGVAAEAAECARLLRVHVQLRSASSAEFFGSFERGPRVRACAGRLERRTRRGAERWVIAEFAIL